MTEESVRLRRTEGLGVSPNSLISPQEWGMKGVEGCFMLEATLLDFLSPPSRGQAPRE